MKKYLPVILFLFLSITFQALGKKNSPNGNSSPVIQATVVGCSPSSSNADLDIGNVRTTIWINGDMWWDLVGSARYEVPKGSGKKSLFSGALWFGGKDGAGNLKVAAQTYRQSGSDFWPGPIDTTSTSITAGQCLHYDRHWKVTRQEVSDFILGVTPTQAIIDWPGNGNSAFSEAHFLAPFHDHSGDGIYDHTDGDYPKYDFGSLPAGPNNKLNGDQTIWWVFNDVGNLHGETGSILPLGLEIRAQAYAFCTSDSDLMNTTFYTYEIINRSSTIINEVYIGNFVDVDLGNYLDDYVASDVSRNMAYGYNGDNDDDGVMGYGTFLPAIGVDLLSGTLTKFMYYNNDATTIGNPVTAQDHYNYLDGKWKDGSELKYGGTGYQTIGAPTCDFMFPGDSDPSHLGTGGTDPGFEWSEYLPCTGCSPNTPSDRRFIMSSGLSSILPGMVINVTTAAVWARDAGGRDSSVAALKRADDRIQNFFDSNFLSIPTCVLTNGIKETSQIIHSVFPSPASGYFIIRPLQEINNVTLKVFSSDGKLVYQVTQHDQEELRVVTSGWASGSYYYQLSDNRKNTASGKLTVINQEF